MSDEGTNLSSQDAPQQLYTLRELAVLGYGTVEDLRRRIRVGDLPRRLVGNKYLLQFAEVEARSAPSRSAETLEEWAGRMAESAPPLSPEQVDMVMEAFASSLRRASVGRPHSEGTDGSADKKAVLPDALMARLHAAAREVVATAPPMSADQRAFLMSLLRGDSR